jgi:hypothetical protein
MLGHTETVSGLLFLLADGEREIGPAGKPIGTAKRAMVHFENILPSNARLELTASPSQLDKAT